MKEKNNNSKCFEILEEDINKLLILNKKTENFNISYYLIEESLEQLLKEGNLKYENSTKTLFYVNKEK
jgi:hypothetical protein